MVRDIEKEDRSEFITMVEEFYSSPAVVGHVSPDNFQTTFDVALDKSPFLRALIIETDNQIGGYGLLSFTYSNEVGGMVVLFEEVYIREAHRGKGLAGEFFKFVESEYPSAKRFRLEVRHDNENAIRLYKKLGYRNLNYNQMIKDI